MIRVIFKIIFLHINMHLCIFKDIILRYTYFDVYTVIFVYKCMYECM